MRRIAVMGAALGLAALLPVPASAQDGGSGALTFPDGDWQGVMVYSAALDFGSGGAGTATGQGSFTVSVSGGAVTSGTFGFSATSDVTFPGASGSATVSADAGSLSGSAGGPVLDPGPLHVSGEVTVNGVTVPVDMDIPPDQTNALTLTIDAVGCDRISGDMSQEVTETIEGAAPGISVPRLVFRWSAVRGGADPAVTEALGRSVDAADKLVLAAARGDLDPAALSGLLAEAEALSADLPTTGDCGAAFSTPLSGAVADLLSALTASAGEVSAVELWAAVNAGVRTGVLTAGSPTAAAAADALRARLEGASPEDARLLYLAARALGDDDLAAEALDAAGGS